MGKISRKLPVAYVIALYELSGVIVLFTAVASSPYYLPAETIDKVIVRMLYIYKYYPQNVYRIDSIAT